MANATDHQEVYPPSNGEKQPWWEKEKIICLQNLSFKVWILLEVRSGVVASATLSDPKKRGYTRVHCAGSQDQCSSLVCSAIAIPTSGPYLHPRYLVSRMVA